MNSRIACHHTSIQINYYFNSFYTYFYFAVRFFIFLVYVYLQAVLYLPPTHLTVYCSRIVLYSLTVLQIRGVEPILLPVVYGTLLCLFCSLCLYSFTNLSNVLVVSYTSILLVFIYLYPFPETFFYYSFLY